MYLPESLTHTESGAVVLRGADDIKAAQVEDIRYQTCGGYYLERPDVDNARLFAAAPDMLHCLRAIDTEARDANRDGDVIIPSHVWDLVSQIMEGFKVTEPG